VSERTAYNPLLTLSLPTSLEDRVLMGNATKHAHQNN